MRRVRQEAVKIYAALMFTLLPLYYTENYYEILFDKKHMFIIISKVLVAFVALSLLIDLAILLRKKELFSTIKNELKSISLLDVVMILFAVTAAISCYLSEDFYGSLSGEQAWFVGTYNIVLGTIVYFIISRWFSGKSDIWVYVFAGTLAVVGIGVVDRLGYDFLIMHDEIPLQYNIFISTIGNVNFWGAYLSMMVPFFMLATIFLKSRFSRFLVRLLLLISYFSLYITFTNTTYLGIAVGMIFVVWYSLKDRRRMINLAINILLFVAAGGVAEFIWKHESLTPRPIDTDSVSLLLLSHRLYLAPIAVATVIFAAIFIVDGIKDKDKLKRIRSAAAKILPIVWLVICGIGVAGAIVYTVINYSLEIFNYRGSIWYFSVTGFCDGDILKKIFGAGPGLLDVVTRYQIENADFYVVWDYLYNTAHNDLLEYLVTTGVIGFVLKMLMYIAPYILFARKGDMGPQKAAVIAALTGFIGQGLVTGPYILTYVIYIVFLGFIGAYRRIEMTEEVNV